MVNSQCIAHMWALPLKKNLPSASTFCFVGNEAPGWVMFAHNIKCSLASLFETSNLSYMKDCIFAKNTNQCKGGSFSLFELMRRDPEPKM